MKCGQLVSAVYKEVGSDRASSVYNDSGLLLVDTFLSKQASSVKTLVPI